MSSNARKQQHANQERKRRLHKKESLACLKSRAMSINATKRDQAAYHKALQDRECFLKSERARKKKERKKLKELAVSGEETALAKILKIKRQKHSQYLKNKALGKRKEWNKKSRRAKMWNFIKSEINIKQKPVNGNWVK